MRPMWEKKRHRSFAKINSGKPNSIQQRSTVWTLEPYSVTTETNWIFFTLYNVVQNDSGDHFIQLYCCTLRWYAGFPHTKQTALQSPHCGSNWFFFLCRLICEGDILFFLLISIVFDAPKNKNGWGALCIYLSTFSPQLGSPFLQIWWWGLGSSLPG